MTQCLSGVLSQDRRKDTPGGEAPGPRIQSCECLAGGGKPEGGKQDGEERRPDWTETFTGCSLFGSS